MRKDSSDAGMSMPTQERFHSWGYQLTTPSKEEPLVFCVRRASSSERPSVHRRSLSLSRHEALARGQGSEKGLAEGEPRPMMSPVPGQQHGGQ